MWEKPKALLMLKQVVQVVTIVLCVYKSQNDKIYGEISLERFQGSDRAIFVSEDSNFKLF
jgi:hypothetical protein